MCYHNKCGKIDKDNCTSLLNCSHKAFTVHIDGKWVTAAFLCVTFYRNIDMPDIIHADSLLSLNFWWNRALSFNLQIKEDNRTGQCFAGFKCGIINNHLMNYHVGTILPYSLFVIDNMKALKPSQRGAVTFFPSMH